MKKVLIYLDGNSLSNSGGPKGYNFNLLDGLKKIGSKNIYFLPSNNKSIIDDATNKFKKINNKFLYSFLKGIRDLYKYLKLIIPFKHKAAVDLNQYDVIHFHDTSSMYSCRKSIKKYTGKIILTTHCPIMPYREGLTMIPKFYKIIFFPIFYYSKHFDKFAIKNADIIISPNKYATESYDKAWRNYHRIANKKTKYLLTGALKPVSVLTKKETLEKYNITANKFYICFIGRHDRVKGYDVLVNVARNFEHKFDDMRFVIAGNPKPLYPPKLSNWFELGFIKDAQNVMAACDVYISANTDTYFDLAIIQAMSVGTIILARRVGGNKFFESDDFPGILLFDTLEELEQKIIYISKLTKLDKKILQDSNVEMYTKFFTTETFAKNYINIINNI